MQQLPSPITHNVLGMFIFNKVVKDLAPVLNIYGMGKKGLYVEEGRSKFKKSKDCLTLEKDLKS